MPEEIFTTGYEGVPRGLEGTGEAFIYGPSGYAPAGEISRQRNWQAVQDAGRRKLIEQQQQQDVFKNIGADASWYKLQPVVTNSVNNLYKRYADLSKPSGGRVSPMDIKHPSYSDFQKELYNVKTVAKTAADIGKEYNKQLGIVQANPDKYDLQKWQQQWDEYADNVNKTGVFSNPPEVTPTYDFVKDQVDLLKLTNPTKQPGALETFTQGGKQFYRVKNSEGYTDNQLFTTALNGLQRNDFTGKQYRDTLTQQLQDQYFNDVYTDAAGNVQAPAEYIKFVQDAYKSAAIDPSKASAQQKLDAQLAYLGAQNLRKLRPADQTQQIGQVMEKNNININMGNAPEVKATTEQVGITTPRVYNYELKDLGKKGKYYTRTTRKTSSDIGPNTPTTTVYTFSSSTPVKTSIPLSTQVREGDSSIPFSEFAGRGAGNIEAEFSGFDVRPVLTQDIKNAKGEVIYDKGSVLQDKDLTDPQFKGKYRYQTTATGLSKGKIYNPNQQKDDGIEEVDLPIFAPAEMAYKAMLDHAGKDEKPMISDDYKRALDKEKVLNEGLNKKVPGKWDKYKK